MTFTCDKCQGEYDASKANAVAHIYVKDSRCNHIEARCTHCGTREVIFLGPHRIEEVIRSGDLPPSVAAEAGADLRVRAENAWAAAERGDRLDETPPAAGMSQTVVQGELLQRYELTARHEDLLAAFGETLENIPDDLFWDGLQSEHDRSHPERWTD